MHLIQLTNNQVSEPDPVEEDHHVQEREDSIDNLKGNVPTENDEASIDQKPDEVENMSSERPKRERKKQEEEINVLFVRAVLRRSTNNQCKMSS